jgi:hypothetical protein
MSLPSRVNALVPALGSILAATLLASAGLGATLPASANADATIAPPPIFSTAPGLPDNRVYEQVSPTDKNGNDAGASTNTVVAYGGLDHYALAALDGNGVLFEGSGPMGETAAGYNLYFEAQRSATGWSTRAIMPRAQASTGTIGGTLNVQPHYVDPSSDLSHVMFLANSGSFAPNSSACDGEHQLYLSGPDRFVAVSGPDPFVAATWLDRPVISNPIEACGGGIGGEAAEGDPVGGTPDFSTVYFTYPGTLLPEDELPKGDSRAEHVTNTESYVEQTEPWGFYEYSGGVLSEAGVLPDGSLDPFGAVPAASGHGRAITGNQIADEGKRAFFVSPDPASCGNGNNCGAGEDPPELYVRENGEKTVLVSRDTLLPQVNGLPAPAPDGALGFTGSTQYVFSGLNTSFVYASPDGSQAFFQSSDCLTKAALIGGVCGGGVKTYDFDVETSALTYLPGVVGQIVTSDQNGSSFAFVSPEAGAEEAELDLWSGPGGGTVTPITQMNGKPMGVFNGVGADVRVARMSSDGSVVVFMTRLLLPGHLNSGTELEQIYRYDVADNTLGCVSCAPAGVAPTSNAEMSVLEANERGAGLDIETGLVDERGISSDGSRIFFDTADPLVPQATNTGATIFNRFTNSVEPQGRNVYEWENGTVYLLSGGKSSRSSFFLDNSENGEDVFFATTEGLVPGDTDGAYDVYDARIPHPGDNPPPAAVPCEGSVCQGPPNVPSPLTPPASATFSGLGNIAPELAAKPAAKPKPKATKCKKGFVKKKNKCVKAKNKGKKAKKASADRRASR